MHSLAGTEQSAQKPIARVVLGSGAPAELIGILAAFGIESPSEASAGPEDLRIEFDAAAPARMSIATAKAAMALLTKGEAQSTAANCDFDCDNPQAAACFILSRALGLATPFLTASESMLALISEALKAGRDCARILIEGETGSGKESLVELIHKVGHRGRELVYVDCAALDHSFSAFAPSDLAAARPPRPQTLFLNRIGELPLRAQLRLASAVRANVEGTAATNASESRMRYIAVVNHPSPSAAGQSVLSSELRESFETTLTIPPLRARRDDIPLLARHFLRAINPAMSFARAAIRTLADYQFPGNVRELQNLVTRFAIVPLDSTRRAIGRADVLSQLALAHPDLTVDTPSRYEARRRMARKTLIECGGDPDAASRKLGITARELFRLTMMAVPRSRKSRTHDRSI